jgi:ribosomal protein S18 acetylase RimI-like enzyme
MVARMQVRRLIPSDAELYRALRLQGLRESPSSFSSSYEEEIETPIEMIAGFLVPEPSRAVFGAFGDGALVGMVGFGRETLRKTHHKGFMRSMYVTPAHRGRGAAKRLVGHALAFAASIGVRQVNLTVTAGNVAAMALYESQGFKTYGVEHGSLLVDGAFYDDIHMVRFLQKG